MLADLAAENFSFEDKTEKKYGWNIDNYSVLKKAKRGFWPIML